MPIENIIPQNNTQNIQLTPNAKTAQKSQYNARKIAIGLAATGTLIATGLAIYTFANKPQEIIQPLQPTKSFFEGMQVSAISGFKGCVGGFVIGLFGDMLTNRVGNPLDSLDMGGVIGAYGMIAGALYSAASYSYQS